MTAIDDRAKQWGEKLGAPLTEERQLSLEITYRAYFNAVLFDIAGAGVYTFAEASVAQLFQTPAQPTTSVVEAIDVASYQPRDLGPLINSCNPRPQHVVVHLYIEYEAPPAQHSREQIASARANGCTAGGYLFCYPGADPRQSVQQAIAVARSAGLELPILWLDVETYDGRLVTSSWIAAAIAQAELMGQGAGIYTSEAMWRQLGNPTAFSPLPLWNAAWNGRHDLAMPVEYGGWRSPSAGHQYGGDPLDRNVFALEVTQ